jgi:hypothetical protein
MSDLGDAQNSNVNWFTGAERALRQYGRPARMVHAGHMERDMSKANDISTLDLGGDATFTVRVLRDDELENVSGGAAIHGDLMVTSFHDPRVSNWSWGANQSGTMHVMVSSLVSQYDTEQI